MTAACGSDHSPGPAAVRRPAYFDVKGFLDTQARELNQSSPAVEKQASLRDDQRETTRVPHVDWTKELQIFYQADINKPALRGSYTLDSTTVAPGGLPVRVYQRKPGIETPVARLKVIGMPNDVREIDVLIVQNNPLFFSQKKLALYADHGGHLSRYGVEGVQKLVLFDTLRYSAAARVMR